MSETRRILDMLQEGKITAQEAEHLLQAVDKPDTPAQLEAASTPPPALAKHFQTAFQIAFGVSLALAAATGYWCYTLYRGADNHVTWRLVGVMLLLGCALLLAGLALWLWQARWLHVRMGEENGKRFHQPAHPSAARRLGTAHCPPLRRQANRRIPRHGLGLC